MSESRKPYVAIVDLGMGNLFSVRQACEQVGMDARITSSSRDISSAGAVILPGVGAFGSAMGALKRLKLIDPLLKAASSKPFMGICLGMQLMMTESHEFGRHGGLGIIKGAAVKFDFSDMPPLHRLKIPHIGWNRVSDKTDGNAEAWKGTLMDGVRSGDFMYFVHSYYVVPQEDGVLLSNTTYGRVKFCSSLRRDNVFACQYHPERSGKSGLKVYKNFASVLSLSFA